jgi:hypothetical protein
MGSGGQVPSQSMDISKISAADKESSNSKKKDQTGLNMEIFTPATLNAFNARRKVELGANSSGAATQIKGLNDSSEQGLTDSATRLQDVDMSGADEDEAQASNAASSTLNWKGATSNSNDVTRPAPVSRDGLLPGNTDNLPKSLPNGSSMNPTRPRPPPKPKAPNLFIPKKPAVRYKHTNGSQLNIFQVKRALPSDATFPNPKRRET